MNLEVILWLIAFFVLTESIYIYLLKRNKDNSTFGWKFIKAMAVIVSIIILLAELEFLSVGPLTFRDSLVIDYSRIIWEVMVLGGLFLFLVFNKWIAKKIAPKVLKVKRYYDF